MLAAKRMPLVIKVLGYVAIATNTETMPQNRRHQPNAFGKPLRFGDRFELAVFGDGS